MDEEKGMPRISQISHLKQRKHEQHEHRKGFQRFRKIPYKLKRSKVNSMDFSEDGNFLVCADDTTLIIFDAMNAKKVKTLFNKVNGIRNVRFTHSNEAVICSTKQSPCNQLP